jgi:flagellar assembly protein FliH
MRALVRDHLGDQLPHINWRIVEDGTLTPGGCRVEVGASEVDATLETRWRRVVEGIGISEDWLAGKEPEAKASER